MESNLSKKFRNKSEFHTYLTCRRKSFKPSMMPSFSQLPPSHCQVLYPWIHVASHHGIEDGAEAVWSSGTKTSNHKVQRVCSEDGAEAFYPRSHSKELLPWRCSQTRFSLLRQSLYLGRPLCRQTGLGWEVLWRGSSLPLKEAASTASKVDPSLRQLDGSFV